MSHSKVLPEKDIYVWRTCLSSCLTSLFPPRLKTLRNVDVNEQKSRSRPTVAVVFKRVLIRYYANDGTSVNQTPQAYPVVYPQDEEYTSGRWLQSTRLRSPDLGGSAEPSRTQHARDAFPTSEK